MGYIREDESSRSLGFSILRDFGPISGHLRPFREVLCLFLGIRGHLERFRVHFWPFFGPILGHLRAFREVLGLFRGVRGSLWNRVLKELCKYHANISMDQGLKVLVPPPQNL